MTKRRRVARKRGVGRLMVGLMSGTSVDGIDAALVRVGKTAAGRYTAKVLHHAELAWPEDLRERLLRVMAPARTTTQEICQLNVAVAEWFACAAANLMETTTLNLTGEGIAAICSHGQTVCHLPRGRIAKEVYPSSLQLGDPSVIAALTGVTTVGNFRPADITVGGQGAPLVPWVDEMLLTHRAKTRCVQNIGGIANVTYLPAEKFRRRGGGGEQVIAFDTGPGNMLLDAVVSLATGGEKRYDKDGRLARRGKLDVALLKRLQGHSFFSQPPPKSTGREEFGISLGGKLFKSVGDKKPGLEILVHTLARLTAWSIADAYERFLPRMPDEVILCGGGADNPVMVEMLGDELGKRGTTVIRRIDEFGIPNKAKEAASFALLGAATLDGVAGNLPGVTGARHAVVLGVVARP